jgi:hypothetical protein
VHGADLRAGDAVLEDEDDLREARPVGDHPTKVDKGDLDAPPLALGAGVPSEWIDEGIRVRDLPTWWGPVSCTLGRDSTGRAVLSLTCSETPPNGFAVPERVTLVVSGSRESTALP